MCNLSLGFREAGRHEGRREGMEVGIREGQQLGRKEERMNSIIMLLKNGLEEIARNILLATNDEIMEAKRVVTQESV